MERDEAVVLNDQYRWIFHSHTVVPFLEPGHKFCTIICVDFQFCPELVPCEEVHEFEAKRLRGLGVESCWQSNTIIEDFHHIRLVFLY